ncbi:salivary peroxidase/catechol oxidase-like [Anticarsia gemmatalis]|uniref:salivary peroxidase/catechol oxidase-like n=1 Tax=Anticarsia gemmatalis TaxID=129554 RepID=UPI003F76CBCA
MLILLVICLCIGSLNAVLYDCVTGKPVSSSRLQVYYERNNTRYCVIDVKPCDPNEGRRVDGSCNNFEYPSWGMIRTPSRRVLPPDFSEDYQPRKAKDGGSLPLERYLRTQILTEGVISDLYITQLVSYYVLFVLNDVNTIHDILNYAINTTYCCQPEGKTNYICAPNKIPVDDPVHRYSGVSCQNLTRPQSFQYFGCVDFGNTTWLRIGFATPVFDLSGVYGNALDAIYNLRTYTNGLVKMEVENGQLFPPKNPTIDPLVNYCVLNQLPRETRCHKYQPNGAIGANLFIILFYRQHNYLAQKLADMNPCWDDDKIFNTARDINIAIEMQIYLYEMLPVIFGRRNMIKDGLISRKGKFRDLYKGLPPRMSDEYVYMKRWFHTAQEPTLKLYDKDGYFVRTFPAVNMSARTGFLAVDNNFGKLLQGSFRQLGAKFDNTIDSEMSERILGGIQFASDGSMNDLAKGRLMGYPPYVKYREFCDNQPYTSFDDLERVMTKEKIFRLKELYDDIIDLDLMGGTWAEKPIRRGRVPYTVYCLLKEQLKYTMASDRHWYERPNRPNAFTEDQLKAIRKVKLAGVMCTTAPDSITKIQPNAFYSISWFNPLVDCNSRLIRKLDLSPWEDPACLSCQ